MCEQSRSVCNEKRLIDDAGKPRTDTRGVAVLQTRDGYLWLGTNDGVVRLDGVWFTVYNATNAGSLRVS
jgi:hypothetical protein